MNPKIRQHIPELRENVVIDCGHTPVRSIDQRLSFGVLGEPSSTELQTLDLGIRLARELANSGRNTLLNICLSDTSRNIDPVNRSRLKSLVDSGDLASALPSSYRALLAKESFDFSQLRVTLQTRNSNLFSNALKGAKKSLVALDKDPQRIFDTFNAIFLSDRENHLFALTHPFLFEREQEIGLLGSAFLADPDFDPSPADLAQAPLLRLKHSPVINLYSRSNGILCPATYGGLLLNFNDQFDHIAIYSRNDDDAIAEKILRGVIAAHVIVRGFKRNCLQVILPEAGERIESSFLSADILLRRHAGGFKSFQTRLAECPVIATDYQVYS